MTKLKVADLLACSPVDPRDHLDAERVAHYARMGEATPPVVVFATPEGMLLADGYHRLAAARQRGAATIDAEIRRGSRADALEYAATVGAAQRGITTEQAEDAIKRRGSTRPSNP
jgi:ParB-like chromosome segregation protein Spo0J